jgi:hypothetical protein
MASSRRTVDGDRGAGASLRVMGTAFATGHAAGVAAALTADNGDARTGSRPRGAQPAKTHDCPNPSCLAVLIDHVLAAAQAARTARFVAKSGHGLRNLAAMMTHRSVIAMSLYAQWVVRRRRRHLRLLTDLGQRPKKRFALSQPILARSL